MKNFSSFFLTIHFGLKRISNISIFLFFSLSHDINISINKVASRVWFNQIKPGVFISLGDDMKFLNFFDAFNEAWPFFEIKFPARQRYGRGKLFYSRITNSPCTLPPTISLHWFCRKGKRKWKIKHFFLIRKINNLYKKLIVYYILYILNN